MSHCELCHKPFLPDVMGFAPTTLEIGDDEKFIVHQHCCDEVLRNCHALHGKKYDEYIKKILRGLSMILCLVLSLSLFAEVNAGKKDTDVKGCLCTYNSRTGTFLYEPFVKVADKTSDNEYGEREIWGFKLWELEPDENGKVHPINVPANRFVPADGKYHTVKADTSERKVKCPFWQNTNPSAEQ